MPFKKIWLYILTVRHLSIRQVCYQVIRMLGLGVRPWATPVACRFVLPMVSIPPLSRWQADIPVAMFSHCYQFLNRQAHIKDEVTDRVDWEYAAEGGLWLDNLHYLRYWDALGPKLSLEEQGQLLLWLQDWVEHLSHAPRSKALYPPYNASERAYSLGRFLLTHAPLANVELDRLVQLVIARDLNYVAAQLEFHLGGNHLLKNLMSLAWGICLFEGDDAKRWQGVLDRELEQELRRQILADGFHYERSPMYHNIALLDLLDVINVVPDGPARDRLVTLARAMIAATKVVTHADGEIAFFNDCALDTCPRSADIIEYGEILCGGADRPAILPDAGLYAYAAGEHIQGVAKFGSLGADEQMGHVHSDLFSFEMSVKGWMLILNSGTSTYYDQPFRDYERSGAAHNTLVLPGYLQCQHWSSFRVAARARPVYVRFESSEDEGVMLSGEVELLGAAPQPRFARRLQACPSGTIVIVDTLTASRSAACSHFHLDPDVRIVAADEERRQVFLELSDGQRIALKYSGGRLAIEDCLVSRCFNSRRPSKRLVISGWNGIAIPSTLEIRIELVHENSH